MNWTQLLVRVFAIGSVRRLMALIVIACSLLAAFAIASRYEVGVRTAGSDVWVRPSGPSGP